LGSYQNGTTKMVFCKCWGQKCVLASGVKSKTNPKFLYKSGVEMSFEELEELVEALGKCTKAPGAVNYHELSETANWKGEKFRLVLKDSEYQGLVLVRMKSCAVADDFDVEIDNPDPEPLEIDSQVPTTNVKWNECFDKFYMSKNDNWPNLKSTLREFCIDLNHILNVDEESQLISPPESSLDAHQSTSAAAAAPPLPQNVEQVQIHPPPKNVKRKKQDTKGGEAGNKRAKKNNKELLGEEDEQEVSKALALQLPSLFENDAQRANKDAVKLILAYMCTFGKSCFEKITCFKNELNNRHKYNYEMFIAHSKEIEETATRMNKLESR
jgi:hypothetical protein